MEREGFGALDLFIFHLSAGEVMKFGKRQTMSWVKISFSVFPTSTRAWPRYIKRWRAGAGWVPTSADILSLNSPIVVAVDMPEKVSLLASCDGDRMTRLM